MLLQESNHGSSEKVPQFLYDEYGEHLDHTTTSRLWNMVEGVMLHTREGTRGPRLPSVFMKSVVIVQTLCGLTLSPVQRMALLLPRLFVWGRGVILTSSTCCEHPLSTDLGYLLRQKPQQAISPDSTYIILYPFCSSVIPCPSNHFLKTLAFPTVPRRHHLLRTISTTLIFS